MPLNGNWLHECRLARRVYIIQFNMISRSWFCGVYAHKIRTVRAKQREKMNKNKPTAETEEDKTK